MKASIKAEIRKLFSVRSTYIIILIAFAIIVFFGFFVVGFHVKHQDTTSPLYLSSNISGALNAVMFFCGLIAILLATHEYRYNTILYSLTNTNSRSKVFYSKIIVISALAILYTLVIAAIAPIMTYWGIHAHGLKLVPQTFYFRDIIWRSLFFGWGYSMAALLLAFIIRNQIATIVTLLAVPSLVDGLLSLVLKNNIVYLPFDALQRVVGRNDMLPSGPSITPFHAMLLVSVYLIVGWMIAWVLFLRRDAGTNVS